MQIKIPITHEQYIASLERDRKTFNAIFRLLAGMIAVCLATTIVLLVWIAVTCGS